MPKGIRLDIPIGYSNNRLTVISESETKVYYLHGVQPKKIRFFNCKCACGKLTNVSLGALRSGSIKSCGCLSIEASSKQGKSKRTHGQSKTHSYLMWNNMIQRCYNPKNNRYNTYGARGIRVCERWKKDFSIFYKWAIKNGWERGIEIDRRDNDKNYTPYNCRIVTKYCNSNNTTRTVFVVLNGVKMSLKMACNELKLRYKTIHYRMKYKGMSFNEATTYSGSKKK